MLLSTPPLLTATATPINPPLTLSDFSPFYQCCCYFKATSAATATFAGLTKKWHFSASLPFAFSLILHPLSYISTVFNFFLRNLRADYHFNCSVS